MASYVNSLTSTAYNTGYAALHVATEAAGAVRKGLQDATDTVQAARIHHVAYEASTQVYEGVLEAVGIVTSAAKNAMKGTSEKVSAKDEHLTQ